MPNVKDNLQALVDKNKKASSLSPEALENIRKQQEAARAEAERLKAEKERSRRP